MAILMFTLRHQMHDIGVSMLRVNIKVLHRVVLLRQTGQVHLLT